MAMSQPGPWVPDNFYLGGGATETKIGEFAAVLLVCAVVCVLLLPRRYVVVPVLLSLFLIPMGNVMVVGGLHLMTTRILSLCGWIRLGWIRVSSGKSLFEGRLNSIDSAFSWNVICHVAAFVILWRSAAALTNQFGFLWSEFGVYFLLRYLIRDKRDVRVVLTMFAIIAGIIAVEMVYEQARGQNLFGTLVGGVDRVPEIRDGKIRSQGAFGHAILAGTYGAVMLPLFIWLWKDRSKILAALGVTSAVVMVYTCASSTPALGFVASILALCFWPMRKRMRAVRWSIIFGLFTIQLFMKAPVWFLIEHMDVTGSSSGYHRAELVNLFITRFFDWWLIGTRDNASWGWSMFDTSNTYVSQGQSGGLLAFIFFILIISRSFGRLGKARRAATGDKKQEWMLWLLGACLFANIVSFFGITYWDQMEVAWFTFLAMISAVTAPLLEASSVAGSTRTRTAAFLVADPEAPIVGNDVSPSSVCE
jgi:hypothetical protein